MTGRIGLWGPRFAVILLFVVTIAVDVGAVKIGDANITLQSTRYYKKWDLTRFVYRVKLPSKPSGSESSYWVLGTGVCIAEDMFDSLTSEFDWVDDPLHGMRFALTKKNQKFYIWLEGRWDAGPTSVAVHRGQAGSTPDVGTIDGAACEEASISLDVVSGSMIAFPSLSGPGSLKSEDATTLRISSTSQGWALGHSLELTIPEKASYETVERILQVLFQPYEALVGTAEIEVAYELIVSEEDFAGLPEGTYMITVTFTATTD